MFCPSCKAELADGLKFCTQCGARLEAGSTPSTQTSAAAKQPTQAQGVASSAGQQPVQPQQQNLQQQSHPQQPVAAAQPVAQQQKQPKNNAPKKTGPVPFIALGISVVALILAIVGFVLPKASQPITPANTNTPKNRCKFNNGHNQSRRDRRIAKISAKTHHILLLPSQSAETRRFAM